MKKNRLKEMQLTSVDLVRRGANQEAQICLYKNEEGDGPQTSALRKAYNYLSRLFTGEEKPEEISKSGAIAEYRGYIDLLNESFEIIMNSDESPAEKEALLKRSLAEFSDCMVPAVEKWAETSAAENEDNPDEEGNHQKEKNGVETDAGKLTPEERETLKALMAKANGENEETEKNACPPTDEEAQKKALLPESEELDKKSTKPEVPEFVTKALRRNEAFMQWMELRDLENAAKKYEILGEEPEALAKSLYGLKGQNLDLYHSCIAMLDKQVDAVNKSGLFAEIGKSGGSSVSGVSGKVEAFAKSMMDSDNTINYHEAMAKAWENHPELVEEYESERR